MNSSAPPHRLQGFVFAGVGAIAFSGKAIIVKLSYRYGVDAVTVLMYRMLFAFPLFITLSWWSGRGKPPLSRNDWLMLAALGFSGYYLASFLDFAGLQYISANLERLILYLNPTIVLAVSAIFFKTSYQTAAMGGAGRQLHGRARGVRARHFARRRACRARARSWCWRARSATRSI